MKLFKSALLLLIFAPTAAAQGWFLDLLYSLLEVILAPFIGPAAEDICATGLEALNLVDILDCECSAELGEGFSIAGSVACGLQADKPKPCLFPPDYLCGDVSVATTFIAGGQDISGSLEACFEFKSGLPNGILSLPELCVEMVALPGVSSIEWFNACTVTFGGETCQSCTTCTHQTEGGYFKFDCSNADGPVVTKCLGFGFTNANAA